MITIPSDVYYQSEMGMVLLEGIQAIYDPKTGQRRTDEQGNVVLCPKEAYDAAYWVHHSLGNGALQKSDLVLKLDELSQQLIPAFEY